MHANELKEMLIVNNWVGLIQSHNWKNIHANFFLSMQESCSCRIDADWQALWKGHAILIFLTI